MDQISLSSNENFSPMATTQEITNAFCAFGEIYGVKVNQKLIPIWIRVLKKLTSEELEKGVDLYLQSDQAFFPRAGQIYQLGKHKTDNKNEASLITDSIFTAARRYGWDNVGIERAKRDIGPIGWKYITICGGWQTFVQSIISEEQVSTLKAQARTSIQGLIDTQSHDNESPQPNNLKNLKDYNVSIKMIE